MPGCEYKYTLKESKKMTLRKLPLRKCHDGSCPTMTFPHDGSCPTMCSRTLTIIRWQPEWLMSIFFSPSGAENPDNKAKLTWWKVQQPGYAAPQWGGLKNHNQCLQKSKTSKTQETAGNGLSQHYDNHSCFSETEREHWYHTAGTSMHLLDADTKQ